MKRLLSILLFLVLGPALAQRLPPQMSMIGVDSAGSNIPVAEILSGGPPPNGIPAIGFEGDWRDAAGPTPGPRFETAEGATSWLADREPVVAFSLNGDHRAYPLQILTRHEIVNDVVGGIPVAVTFCPLCNSALAFDRRLPLDLDAERRLAAANPVARPGPLSDAFMTAYRAQGGDPDPLVSGLEVTFGVSGMLFNSNLLMFDSRTSTLWSQILGEGNVGTLTGTRLLRYPAQIVGFGAFRKAFPGGQVLSRDSGFRLRYGRNPYPGYDAVDQPPFLFVNPDGSARSPDGRLVAQARVVALELGGEQVAYPFALLTEQRVIDDTVADIPVTVFWEAGTASALDAVTIADARDVGAVGVFRREAAGRLLDFRWDGAGFVDRQTSSRWNLLGQAVSGELAGTRLEPVTHDNTLWFAWAAFRPGTRVFSMGD